MKILSISYDITLLRTRQKILETAGYEVWSADSLVSASEHCKSKRFDLMILGHSIPHRDKEQIISELKSVCDVPVLALERQGESKVPSADYGFDVTEPPANLLQKVSEIFRDQNRVAAD